MTAAYDDAFKKIVAVIKAIPAGSVCSYGQVAARAGLPGRARLVARVLRDSSGQGLPWYRIVRSDGKIAFAEGSSGYNEQTSRLHKEGVMVVNGKVAIKKDQTLDELLWGSSFHDESL